MNKKILLYLLGFLILIALIPLFDVDLSVFLSVKQPVFVLLALLAIAFSFVVLALRLNLLLCALGEKAISFADAYKIEVANRFFLYVAPLKLNIPAKALLLNRRFGTGKGNALAISSYEYFVDLGILFFFGVVGFLFVFRAVSGFEVSTFFIGLISLLLLALFFLTPKKVFVALEKRLQSASDSFIQRSLLFIVKFLSQMREAWLKLIFSRESPAVFGLVAVKFLIAIARYLFLFWAVGYNINFLYVVVVISFSMFLGGVSTIPSGLGVREGAIMLLLGLFGVPVEVSFFAVIANRVLIIPFLILGYFFSMQFGVKEFASKLRNSA